MTAAHIAAMRKGKEQADARRRIAEDAQANAFMGWLRREAAAAHHVANLDLAGLEFGDEEYDDAVTAHRAIRSNHPGLPTDASLRRVRGLDD